MSDLLLYAGRVTPEPLGLLRHFISVLVALFLVQFVVGFTPFDFNAPYEFTLLLNLRSLVRGLTAFGWPRVRMRSGTYETQMNKNDSVCPLQTTSVTVRPPFSSNHLVYHHLFNAFLFYLQTPRLLS
jgi:hypothetical protein